MKKTARNVILFDDNEVRKHLMPFTYTRPTAMLRLGITTISEKWQAMLGEATYSYLTVPYLKKDERMKTHVIGWDDVRNIIEKDDALLLEQRADDGLPAAWRRGDVSRRQGTEK